jgi:hypothetical protein
MKNKILLSTMVASALLLFSGCMDDGKDGKDGNIDEVAVTAVDGYIIGATVKDANGNTAFRNGDGTYSFVKAPRYPLTLTGGKFLDTNETFTGTLYASKGVVVSPITTLVTKLDANGEPTNEIDTARLDKLAAMYDGLSTDDLLNDYMATSNTEIAKLAQLAHVMNQDEDLMKTFKEKLDAETTKNGFDTLNALAGASMTDVVKAGKLSEVKQTVYGMILDAVKDLNSTEGLEKTLFESKSMLSNIAAIEELGGEIGTDIESLKTASALAAMAGDSSSSTSLSASQLDKLGVNSTITEDANLTAMLNDVIKNSGSNPINSKAELTLAANKLKTLYAADNGVDVDDAQLVDAVNALLGDGADAVSGYQSVELVNKIKADGQAVNSYADLVSLVESLKTYEKPVISVSFASANGYTEAFDGNGTVVGTTIATVSATTPAGTNIAQYTLGTSGDASLFDINKTSGVITTTVDFDYETKKSYTFTVEATSQLDDNETVVLTSSQIVTIGVNDVGDFGIDRLVYDNKDTNASSDDTLDICFNASADESTLSADKFSITGIGALSDDATGSYSSITKCYTITGFDTAMEVSVDGNVSKVAMADTVRQAESNDTPKVVTAGLKLFKFQGLEYGFMRDTANGDIWLDRNLGATQVAQNSKDAAAYGDLYQWGRLADGHQKRSSSSTTTLATDINASNIDQTMFIANSNSPFDWVDTGVDDNSSLRLQRISSICPAGFAVPTEDDFKGLSISDGSGAFDKLKLTMAGRNKFSDGSLSLAGSYGYYWTSSVVNNKPRRLRIDPDSKSFGSDVRASGYSVRCKKN